MKAMFIIEDREFKKYLRECSDLYNREVSEVKQFYCTPIYVGDNKFLTFKFEFDSFAHRFDNKTSIYEPVVVYKLIAVKP